MISYRAETSMVSIVREKLARTDDGRALLQQIFTTPADLVPDLTEQTLTVRLHHLTQRAHDDVIRHLCEELNATETLFPGTGLKLIYKLGFVNPIQQLGASRSLYSIVDYFRFNPALLDPQ